MNEQKDLYSNTLMEYCARLVVANWDNRKFRGDFLRRIHTYEEESPCVCRANLDAIELILDTFRKEEKVASVVQVTRSCLRESCASFYRA